MDFERCMDEYAKLIVCGGIRVAPGEKVLINSDIATSDMAHRVAKACYEQGAAKVEIRWSDSKMTAMNLQYASEEILSQVTGWEELQMKEQSEELPCLIHLLCSDPNEGDSVLAQKQAVITGNRLQVMKPHILKMRNRYKWTAACIPTQDWADLIFPGVEDNLHKLWLEILEIVNVNGDGTAVEKMNAKFQTMWSHMDALNSLKLRKLHLETELGTDLHVELHERVPFACACGPQDDYIKNIPSEELFTSPIAGKAEGVLVASVPFIYENQYVEGLKLTFKDGRVTDVKADKGEAFFRKVVETDPGASMLGEVAIVDKVFPIRGFGHIFGHTLLDENAACHIAVGRGFTFLIKDFMTMTPEEIADCGINESGIHCDIMWGTDHTRISGITAEEKEVVIMDDGEWCI